jgi:hypothetical protein
MKQIRWTVSLFLGLAVFSQAAVNDVKTAPPPNLNLVLPSLERAQQQNPALSRAHKATRYYKAFHGDDTQPSAEVTAEVSFTPPDTRTFKIIQSSGEPRGEKIVRDILEQETEPATERDSRDIIRKNYDFVFLRQENFGLLPEYVFRIIPKRKDKGLLLGQIWVDEKTFRIRRIEGVPVKSPSMWIKDIHMTLQFAEVNQMWVPVSLDAIATVRLMGRYTLTGVYVETPAPASVVPKR